MTDQPNEKTICIQISELGPDEYTGVCAILKKRAFFIAGGLSRKFSVTDNDGVDIRKRDNW